MIYWLNEIIEFISKALDSYNNELSSSNSNEVTNKVSNEIVGSQPKAIDSYNSTSSVRKSNKNNNKDTNARDDHK